jgi:DNA mismatch repair protein MutS2
VTPVDILLPANKRLLVVTGPNTGGKTVALKTLGLCALMAESGILIPVAEGSELPFFRGVFADVGDEQNIERNLSTFSAHVTNLCEILSRVSDGGLVLLDEPGVGTDPEEGAALAVGLVRRLEALGARVALTTHYSPVKTFAVGHPGAAVASVEFDLESLTPRYHLLYESLGRSLALPIAKRLGLPEEVLAAARDVQSNASRAWDKALETLEFNRQRLERELAAATGRSAALGQQEVISRQLLDELKERRGAAWREGLQEAREFVRQVKAEGHEVLENLRRGAAARAELNRFAREREAAIAEMETETGGTAEPPPTRGTPQIGDTVEVGGRGIRGDLIEISGDRAWIRRGSLRFEVPTSQLVRVGPQSPASVQVRLASRDEDAAIEISLLGLRTRDAIGQLQSFLDHAVQAGHGTVRIIHGIGSGALRRAVHEYLEVSPYCSSFRAGTSSEGGDGVTLADLAI